MSGWTQNATHWSLLLRSGEAGWSYFYQRYRGPVAALFRRGGLDPSAVDDLVHDFFLGSLHRDFLRRADPARGSFRAYLATAARRFLASHFRDQGRAKRDPGPGGLVQLDEALDLPAKQSASLELAFDRAWAEEVLRRAEAAVAEDYAARGKAAHQRAFELRLGGSSWAEAAAALEASEAAVRGWATRYGDKLADAVRREISDTVAGDAELDQELAYLSRVLATPSPAPPSK